MDLLFGTVVDFGNHWMLVALSSFFLVLYFGDQVGFVYLVKKSALVALSLSLVMADRSLGSARCEKVSSESSSSCVAPDGLD